MKNQTGFGVIGILLVVIAIGLIGLIGWRVWEAGQTKTSNTSANSQSATQSDPYAGWKTYCDDVEKACFKYPADWTINSSTQNNIVSVTLKNPTGSLTGSYADYDTRDGASVFYYTASLEDLSTVNESYKAVGGFDASSLAVYPRYKVVDVTSTTRLVAGQQTTMTNTARFTFKDENTGHLEIAPTTTTGFTAGQAKAWFATSDAKTALLIVKSFYLE